MPLKIIKKKSSPYWYIRGSIKGRSVYQTTGTTDKEIADAERIALERRILEESVYGVRKTITFGEGVGNYLDAGGSKRFLGTYDKDTGEWSGVLGQFVNTPMNTIGQSELDAAARRCYPNAKPQTLNRQFYTPFISVWNFCAQDDLVDQRTWRRPSVKKLSISRRKWFTQEQAGQFLGGAAPHLRVIFLFCLYTGVRITEAIEMRVSDIDLKNRWAVVNSTKTDNRRGVPLHRSIVEHLTPVFMDGRTHAFLTYFNKPYISKRGEDGTVEGGGYFKSAWTAALRRSGLQGFTPYSMRHTLNNWLLMEGVETATREAIMGHDSGSTNAHYVDVPNAHLIEIIDRLPDCTDFAHKIAQNHVSFTQRSAQKRIKAQEKKKARELKKRLINKGENSGAVEEN
jgi:integrase/recombinase XerD